MKRKRMKLEGKMSEGVYCVWSELLSTRISRRKCWVVVKC
jgi:hypothetical protein